MKKQGIGARVLRKEDARHLHGRGSFVSDMMLPGQREVAFLRSPIAHGRIRRIVKPAGHEGSVFTRADLVGAQTMVTRSTVPGYKLSGHAAAGRRQGALRRRGHRDVRRARPAPRRRTSPSRSKSSSTNCPR